MKTVSVSQDEITPVLPSEVTLVADFTLGASVATPELPPYSTDNFTTGRHEYTIGGYTFAIFVDPDEGGKFYWLDNKQFSPSIPDPAQGLFFSKLGAYVEFPAIAGKVLSEVHYLHEPAERRQPRPVRRRQFGTAVYARLRRRRHMVLHTDRRPREPALPHRDHQQEKRAARQTQTRLRRGEMTHDIRQRQTPPAIWPGGVCLYWEAADHFAPKSFSRSEKPSHFAAKLSYSVRSDVISSRTD